MPEKPSKTQPAKTDQKSVKIESTASKPQETSEKKTKSRLPNKTLTDTEVAKKSAKSNSEKATSSKTTKSTNTSSKPQKSPVETKKSTNTSPKNQKPTSTAKKTNIKVITAEPSKDSKKPGTQKSSQPTSKSATKKTVTIKIKPSIKTSGTPSTGKAKKVSKPQTPTKSSSKVSRTIKVQDAKPQKPVAKTVTNQKSSAKSKTPKTPQPEKTSKPSFLSIFSQVIASILGVSSVFFIAMLSYLNFLPTHYLLLIIALILIIASGCGFLLWHRQAKPTIKIPTTIVSVVFSCLYLIGGGYIAQTTGFLNNLKPQDYVSEQYYVIVKNDSPIQDIKELQDKTIGTFNENIELYEEAIKKLNATISAELVTVKSIHAMTEGLLSGDYDAVFLSAVHQSLIDEESAEFSQNTKVIYTIEVKVKSESAVDRPDINVTSEAFTIYISGNDNYGDLAARGLSDVNMLVTVNPVTHEILLTSIPRDYYVQLHGTTGTKDKLTHAGMYGVQMSIETIEDLLGINVDYYVKINFPALVNIVDAIGGIDVYSDTSFRSTTITDVFIPAGNVHMDGKTALAFARERKSYGTGDRHRVQNQRDVLNAIFNKISSSTALLTKANEILGSISNNLDTNISKSEISSLVKLQLQDMPSWQFGEYMLDGSDLYTYTYTFDDMLRFVIVPDPNSVQTAHNYIMGIMEGKTLEELHIPAQR